MFTNLLEMGARRMWRPTRRNFVQSAMASSLTLASTRILSAAGPSERVTLALIGCGGRGRRFFEYVDFVCDPDQQQLGRAAEAAEVNSSRAVQDMRRILDNPDVDAVIIATPDHWHAPAAILACQAGKHVYVEKPISHNFRESQLLLEAAQANQRVVQHGTQRRSSPFVADAIQMLHEGVIGEVLVAKCWNVQKRDDIGRMQPTAPPAGVDYDLWVGPAEWMPYQENRYHRHWRWWHNFGTGDVGNDGCHDLDYARWGLGVNTLPTRVTATGGKYFFDDDQQFPDTATCTFEYPASTGGRPRQLIFEMRLWSRNYPFNCDSGAEFFGTEGRMMLSKRGKLQIQGPRNERVKEARLQWTDSLTRETNRAHLHDFLQAIRTGRGTCADATEAHRTVALAHLANIALRTGRQLEFDPVTEQVVDDDDAQQLLARRYRRGGHWAVPGRV